MKIVLNKCFGGFSISRNCAERMAELGCEHAKEALASKNEYAWSYGYVNGRGKYSRTNPYLIQAVEELGNQANGQCAELAVEEYYFDPEDLIREYDGLEHL